MNNKQLGTNFERWVCEYFSRWGYWVHFLSPDNTGAQPFDVIAVKGKIALAIECKTLTESAKYFSIDRLQDNQIFAFDKWIKCGNREPIILIKQGDDIMCVEWSELKEKRKVKVEDMVLWHTLASAD